MRQCANVPIIISKLINGSNVLGQKKKDDHRSPFFR